MQEFVFTTSNDLVLEIASFIKDYASIKHVSVVLHTFSDSICVEFSKNVSYVTFSDFLLGVNVECRDRNAEFIVSRVSYIA